MCDSIEKESGHPELRKRPISAQFGWVEYIQDSINIWAGVFEKVWSFEVIKDVKMLEIHPFLIQDKYNFKPMFPLELAKIMVINIEITRMQCIFL